MSRRMLTNSEILLRIAGIDIELKQENCDSYDRKMLLIKKSQYKKRLERGIVKKSKPVVYEQIKKKSNITFASVSRLSAEEYNRRRESFVKWLWEEENAS